MESSKKWTRLTSDDKVRLFINFRNGVRGNGSYDARFDCRTNQKAPHLAVNVVNTTDDDITLTIPANGRLYLPDAWANAIQRANGHHWIAIQDNTNRAIAQSKKV